MNLLFYSPCICIYISKYSNSSTIRPSPEILRLRNILFKAPSSEAVLFYLFHKVRYRYRSLAKHETLYRPSTESFA